MKYFLLIAFFGVLFSCSSDLPKPVAPDDLIPEDEMVSLLHDMTILEASIQARYQNVNRFYKVMTKSGREYLKSKGISEKRFEKSYEYYVAQPELMQEMYTKVSDEITIELNKLEQKNP